MNGYRVRYIRASCPEQSNSSKRASLPGILLVVVSGLWVLAYGLGCGPWLMVAYDGIVRLALLVLEVDNLKCLDGATNILNCHPNNTSPYFSLP